MAVIDHLPWSVARFVVACRLSPLACSCWRLRSVVYSLQGCHAWSKPKEVRQWLNACCRPRAAGASGAKAMLSLVIASLWIPLFVKEGAVVGLLNLGSLVLGLIAWILPVVNLMRHEKRDHRDWIVLSIMSISACAISLWFQILYQDHLVKIEDWSALMDTTGAVAFVSAALLIVTIILNAVTLIVYRDRTARGSW